MRLKWVTLETNCTYFLFSQGACSPWLSPLSWMGIFCPQRNSGLNFRTHFFCLKSPLPPNFRNFQSQKTWITACLSPTINLNMWCSSTLLLRGGGQVRLRMTQSGPAGKTGWGLWKSWVGRNIEGWLTLCLKLSPPSLFLSHKLLV